MKTVTSQSNQTKKTRTESPEEKLEIKKNIDFITIKIEACSSKLKICRRFMWRRGILKKEAKGLDSIVLTKEKIKNKTQKIR